MLTFYRKKRLALSFFFYFCKKYIFSQKTYFFEGALSYER